MAAFNYRALDADGREVGGVLEAETSRLARSQLRDRQLSPLEVTPVGAQVLGGMRSGRAGISVCTLSLVTRQWSTLLAAGLTIERSLTALVEQNEDAGVQEVLAGVRAQGLG